METKRLGAKGMVMAGDVGGSEFDSAPPDTVSVLQYDHYFITGACQVEHAHAASSRIRAL